MHADEIKAKIAALSLVIEMYHIRETEPPNELYVWRRNLRSDLDELEL